MHHHNKKGFTLVEIMIVVVIIGLLAAMAIPAFNKVRQTSQDKAIVNNLREIASAAQQYMLDEGVAVVSTTDIIGRGKYIGVISNIASETYDLTVGTDTTEISTEIDGRTVTYKF